MYTTYIKTRSTNTKTYQTGHLFHMLLRHSIRSTVHLKQYTGHMKIIRLKGRS